MASMGRRPSLVMNIRTLNLNKVTQGVKVTEGAVKALMTL